MNREKALQIYGELKAKCPGLLIGGSTLRGKETGINNVDLIWVGKIFPMHLLPIGEMESPSVKTSSPNVLQFKYRGEQVNIYRTDKDKVGAISLFVTGPTEYTIYVRGVARRKGYKLNQYGLFKKDKCVASETEKKILGLLNLPVILPVDRSRFRSIQL